MTEALKLTEVSKTFSVGRTLFGAAKGSVKAVHPITLDVQGGKRLASWANPAVGNRPLRGCWSGCWSRPAGRSK